MTNKFKFLVITLFGVLLSVNMWGTESLAYSIVFKCNGTSNDGASALSTTNEIIDAGSNYMTVTSASKIYEGCSDYGIKGGSSSAKGSITLATTQMGCVKPSKIVVIASTWDSGESCKVLYASINNGAFESLDLVVDWTEFEIEMDGQTDLSTLKLEAKNASKNRFYVQQIDVYVNDSPTPSCAAPTSPTNGATTTTSQVVSWTDGAGDTWDVYWSTSSTAPTAGTTPMANDVTAKSYTITGLSAATTYYWWVRSDCGSNQSAWVAGTSFTTSSVTYTDYLTDCAEPTKVATPTFSVAAGTYNEAKSVTISCSTADATIYYTTDGSDPTTSGTRQTYSSAISVTDDMTIKAYAVKQDLDDSDVATAAYTINYIVTFNLKGHGSAIASLNTIKYDSSINSNKPADPTATGYTFGGWYKEDALTNAWNWESDKVTSGITLYAKWTANTITITWNANGGSVVPTSSSYIYDGASVELPTPTYAGHQFDGWFTEQNAGTKITEIGTTNKPTAAVTYYAHWTEVVTITWVVNGNTADPFATTYASAGKVVMPTGENPTSCDAEEYPYFVGWSTDFGTTSSAPTLVNANTACTADITYYAVFAKGTPGTGYTLVEDAGALHAGDVITFGRNASGKASGAMGGDAYFTAVDATISAGILTSSGAIDITLGGTAGAWTFTTSEGVIGTSAVKSLNSSGSGTTTWTISVADGGTATITSATDSYGSIQYNTSNPRFLNYTSSQGSIEIYKKNSAVYTEYITRCCEAPASELEISGNSTVALNTNVALSTSTTGNGGTVNWSVEPSANTTLSAATGTSINFQASKGGTYTITATQAKNNNYCAQVAQKTVTVTKTLLSLTLSGEGTVFYVGGTYSFTGTATAHYDDGSEADVTASATVTNVNVAQPFAATGSGTATISYTEGGVTKTATSNFTIEAEPTWTITLNPGSGTLASGTGTIVVTQSSPSTTLVACTPKAGCSGGWTFAGWSESNVDVETETTPTWAATSADLSYTATKNVTLYAVYVREGEGPDVKQTNMTSFGSGGAMWGGLSNYNNLVGKYVTYTVPATATKITKIIVTPNNNWGNGKNVSVTLNDAPLWTVYGASNSNPSTYSTEFSVSEGDIIKFAGPGSGTVGVKAFSITWAKPGTTYYYYTNPCGGTFEVTLDPGDGNQVTISAVSYDEYTYENQAYNASITLPIESDLTYNNTDWAFIGWTTQDFVDKTTDKPTLIDGSTYTVTGDAVLKAVYEQTPEGTKYDGQTDGIYKIWCTKDKVRYYVKDKSLGAGGGTFNTTTNCATEGLDFYIAKTVNGWTIQKTNSSGKYIMGVSASSSSLQLSDDPVYWDFKAGSINGDWRILSGLNGSATRGFVGSSSAFGHYDTNQINNSPGFWFEVSIGACSEKIYSHNPTVTTSLKLVGAPAMVTSTAGQKVMVNQTYTVSAKGLKANAVVYVSSPNSALIFRNSSGAALTLNDGKRRVGTADANGVLAETTIQVSYEPTGNTSDGIEQMDVVLTSTYKDSEDQDQTITKTYDHLITGRHLPEKFVIAAKAGDCWYALPSNMFASNTYAGTVIAVDDAENPTEAYTSINAAYATLQSLSSSLPTIYNRFSSMALEGNPAITSTRCLYASDSDTSIEDYAKSASATGDGYQWLLETNDLVEYTLTNVKRSITIRLNGVNRWGMYDGGGTNVVRFIPLSEYKEADFTVVEWFKDKVLIETNNQAVSTSNAKTGIGTATPATAMVDATTYGTNLYTISTPDMTTSAGKPLSFQYKLTEGEDWYMSSVRIPIIVCDDAATSGAVLGGLSAQSKYQENDLVVRDGATLTVDASTGTWNTFKNVIIYPKSKVAVSAEKKFDVSSLTMRGGFDEIYNGGYSMQYDEPQLYVGGTCTANPINYEKRVNLDQMHSLTVPYAVVQSDITYLNGSGVKTAGNLYIDAYNGALRASSAGQSKAWYYYDETDNPLAVGTGYTISAEPAVDGQKYTILRMPLTTGWTSSGGSEDDSKQVAVTAHGATTEGLAANHKGWNCVGNPYMANYANAESDEATFGGGLYVGYLSQTAGGGYNLVNDAIRYVTIPDDDGHGFKQVRIKSATLQPFRYFFVQVATSGNLTFSKSGHVSAAPRRVLNTIPEEIELGILLSHNAETDNCGLLIGEAFSEEYEVGDDMEKMIGEKMAVYTITGGYQLAFNAIKRSYAEGFIPVGYKALEKGEYTFSFDDDYTLDPSVEHVYLLENNSEVTDLLLSDYKFETEAGTFDERFALRIVFDTGTPTLLEGGDISETDNMPEKFIYRGHLYIRANGKVYDGYGKAIK